MANGGVVVGEALAAVYADYLSDEVFAELRGEVPISEESWAFVKKPSERNDIVKNDGCVDGRFVPGVGETNQAPLVLVGEAPGWTEAKRGKPFVGAAGRVLDKCLDKVGIERSEVWITNVVKWHPPGNRDPRPEERRTASALLRREIQAVSAEDAVVVTLGKNALLTIVGEDAALAEYQGRLVPWQRYPGGDLLKRDLFAMRHPATALYNPSKMSSLFEDWQTLDGILVERGWGWGDDNDSVDRAATEAPVTGKGAA